MENNIKKLRQELGLTQEDLARKTGVRRETIVFLEQGKYNPSLKLASDVANVLNKKIDDVFKTLTSGNDNHFHVGVYGILVIDRKVLMIKKSRGAYKGKYDLPGGKIEFGEETEEALRREFIEETGITIDSYKFLGYQEHFQTYKNEENRAKKLHHIGLYFHVSAKKQEIKSGPDGRDSLGAEFIDTKKIKDLKVAPIANLALKNFSKNI